MPLGLLAEMRTRRASRAVCRRGSLAVGHSQPNVPRWTDGCECLLVVLCPVRGRYRLLKSCKSQRGVLRRSLRSAPRAVRDGRRGVIKTGFVSRRSCSLSLFARLLCVSIRPASLSSPSISREYSRGRDASRRHGLKSPASGLYRHKLFQTRLLEGRRASQRSGRGRRHGRNAKESAMAQDFSGPNQRDGLLRAFSIGPRR